VPVPRPTSVCFGGPRMDQLYITSASDGLSADQLREAPLSGSLFVCEPGVKGLLDAEFNGSTMTEGTFDALIVGGGVIGSSAAYLLAIQADFDGRIAVIEKDSTYTAAPTPRSADGVRQQ